MTPVPNNNLIHSKRGFLTTLSLCAVLFSLAPLPISRAEGGSGNIADRIVVGINNIPYSQNEIESYINIKECLRDDAGKSQMVQEANWNQALEAFTRDMMIHQEASKSSGFRPSREAILKLRFRCEKNMDEAKQFKPALDRLGIRRFQMETEILKIATVENFIRGKRSLTSNGGNAGEGSVGWEEELRGRTVIRYFENAKTWTQTHPKL